MKNTLIKSFLCIYAVFKKETGICLCRLLYIMLLFDNFSKIKIKTVLNLFNLYVDDLRGLF